MRKYISYALLVLTLFCCGALIDRFTDRLIFDPTRDELPLTLPFEDVTFAAKNGQKLHGIYLAAKAQADTILFFHGNSYNVTHFEDFAKIYAAQGYGVLVFDYRGYGKSEGKNTERRMYQDGQSALEWLLKDKRLPPQKIILWGFSLGNAVAVETAKNNDLPFKAVILQSPFSNTPQMGYFLLTGGFDPQSNFQRLFARLVSPLLFNKRFDNLAKIKEIQPPLFIGYSQADKTIPWQMSRQLALAAPKHAGQYLSPVGAHTEFDWFAPAALEFLRGLETNPAQGARKSK